MIHTLYRVTNRVNGRAYYGIHSTRDLNDQYLGSGKIIRQAIMKYGRQSFVKEVLMTFPTRQDAVDHEKALVTLDFIKRHDAYNIVEGGGDPPHSSQQGQKGAIGCHAVRWQGPDNKSQRHQQSELISGHRNPNVGGAITRRKRWVNNGVVNKQINDVDAIPVGFVSGRLMKQDSLGRFV